MSKYINVTATYKPTPKLGVVALFFGIASVLFTVMITLLLFTAYSQYEYATCAARLFQLAFVPVLIFNGVSLGLSIGACCLPERKVRLPITSIVLSALVIAYALLATSYYLFHASSC